MTHATTPLAPTLAQAKEAKRTQMLLAVQQLRESLRAYVAVHAGSFRRRMHEVIAA